MGSSYMDSFLDWLESTTPEERLGRVSAEQTRPVWGEHPRDCDCGDCP